MKKQITMHMSLVLTATIHTFLTIYGSIQRSIWHPSINARILGNVSHFYSFLNIWHEIWLFVWVFYSDLVYPFGTRIIHLWTYWQQNIQQVSIYLSSQVHVLILTLGACISRSSSFMWIQQSLFINSFVIHRLVPKCTEKLPIIIQKEDSIKQVSFASTNVILWLPFASSLSFYQCYCKWSIGWNENMEFIAYIKYNTFFSKDDILENMHVNIVQSCYFLTFSYQVFHLPHW